MIKLLIYLELGWPLCKSLFECYNVTLMIEGLALTEQSLVRLVCSLLPWPFPLGFRRLTTRYVILLSQFSLIILLSRLAAELSALREAILSTQLS
jgi:hypothetical protein